MSLPERRKPFEEMSKDELIGILHKVRTQTLQLAQEKKLAVDTCETLAHEKEDIKNKAMTLIRICKDLESENNNMQQFRQSFFSFL
jgi:hypothetical protein